jgi:hypothetical protein
MHQMQFNSTLQEPWKQDRRRPTQELAMGGDIWGNEVVLRRQLLLFLFIQAVSWAVSTEISWQNLSRSSVFKSNWLHVNFF